MEDADTLRGRRIPSASIVLTAPRRQLGVTEIARQLLSQLLSGSIAPGTRLPSERQMTEDFKVSRSTIREALKVLDVLGIVEVRQGDGTYLKQTTSDLLPQAIEWGLMLGERRTRDLIEARRHIEILSGRLAAERADESDISALRGHLDRMTKAPDNTSFADADVAFHLALATAADNSVLEDILRSISSLLRVWIRRAVEQAGQTRTSIAEHAAVLAAIESHSPDLAADAMAAHMDAAAARLRDSLADDDQDMPRQ